MLNVVCTANVLCVRMLILKKYKIYYTTQKQLNCHTKLLLYDFFLKEI